MHLRILSFIFQLIACKYSFFYFNFNSSQPPDFPFFFLFKNFPWFLHFSLFFLQSDRVRGYSIYLHQGKLSSVPFERDEPVPGVAGNYVPTGSQQFPAAHQQDELGQGHGAEELRSILLLGGLNWPGGEKKYPRNAITATGEVKRWQMLFFFRRRNVKAFCVARNRIW